MLALALRLSQSGVLALNWHHIIVSDDDDDEACRGVQGVSRGIRRGDTCGQFALDGLHLQSLSWSSRIWAQKCERTKREETKELEGRIASEMLVRMRETAIVLCSRTNKHTLSAGCSFSVRVTHFGSVAQTKKRVYDDTRTLRAYAHIKLCTQTSICRNCRLAHSLLIYFPIEQVCLRGECQKNGSAGAFPPPASLLCIRRSPAHLIFILFPTSFALTLRSHCTPEEEGATVCLCQPHKQQANHLAPQINQSLDAPC